MTILNNGGARGRSYNDAGPQISWDGESGSNGVEFFDLVMPGTSPAPSTITVMSPPSVPPACAGEGPVYSVDVAESGLTYTWWTTTPVPFDTTGIDLEIYQASAAIPGPFALVVSGDCGVVDSLPAPSGPVVLPVGTSSDTVSGCDSVLVGSTWYDRDTVVNDTLVGASVSGCDSIVTITIDVETTAIASITATLPPSGFSFGGDLLTAPGIYADTVPGGASSGCDSITILDLRDPVTGCADRFTVVSYNLLRYPGSTGDERDPLFRRIIDSLRPDILVLQEVNNPAAAVRFRDSVARQVDPGYGLGDVIDGFDTENVLIYDTSVFRFVDNVEIPVSLGPPLSTPARPINQFTLVHRASCRTIRVYGLHLKAGTSSSDEAIRQAQIDLMRLTTDALPPGTDFIVAGDMNSYSDSEPAYVRLTEVVGGVDGHAVDLLTLSGIWNDPSYAIHHTQSTRTRLFGGGANGGLDDRLDMVLFSRAIDLDLNGVNFTGLYQSYGNDGLHYNDSINALPNLAVGASMAQALHDASDHLPVVAGFSVCFTPDTTVVADTICQGEVFIFADGDSTAIGGRFLDTLVSSQGCDSLVRTEVTVSPTFTDPTTSPDGCDSVFAAGAWFTASTAFTDTLSTVTGCDSLVPYAITVRRSVVDSFAATGCDSVWVGGTWYTADTSIVDVVPGGSSSGCDSTAVTDVVVHPSVNVVVDTAGCDSVVYAGTTWTSDTVLIDTSTTAAGCDSVVTVRIDVVPAITVGPLALDGCDTVLLPTGGAVTASGLYADTVSSAGGCDSVTRYDVTISPSVDSVRTVVACDSVIVGGLVLRADTVLVDSSLTTTGCDSVTTTVVTVRPSVRRIDTVAGCDSVLHPLTGWITRDTVVRDTLATSFGCDSVVGVVATVRASRAVADTLPVACDSIVLAGDVFTADTVVTRVLSTGAGCDSVVTKTLRVRPSVLRRDTVRGCDTATIGTQEFTRDTVLTDSFLTVFGCDSVEVVIVEVGEGADGVRTAVGCDSTVVNGLVFRTDTTVRFDAGTAIDGCDSTTVWTIDIDRSATLTEAPGDTVICPGDALAVSAVAQDAAGWTWQVDDGSGFVDAGPDASSWTLVNGPSAGDSILVRAIVDGGCGRSDTSAVARVRTSDSGVGVVDLNDTVACSDVLLVLDASRTAAISYGWSDGQDGAEAFVTQDGLYVVTYTFADGCSARDSVDVRIVDCDSACTVALPTAFSPDGNGRNDVLRVIETCGDLEMIDWMVVDRWGEVVHRARRVEDGWDGIYAGRPAPMGVYAVELVYRRASREDVIRRTMTVTLVR